MSFSAFGQNKKLDKLEQLYAQQHYKIVLAKAEKLLNSPEYDFSKLPSLYKSMSLFQLSQNEYYLKRNPNALKEAEELFIMVRTSESGNKIFAAHMHEISDLKEDITSWGEDLYANGKIEESKQVQKVLVDIFSKIPSNSKKDGKPVTPTRPQGNDERSKIVAFAEKSIGTPYVWGGTSTKGFDCSGYTTYVMKEFDITMPRRATDQQKASKVINKKDAQKGDLVFFNNGSGISHVGIIVSEKGEPLTMIHASSSQGITITNLESSSYWNKRIDSFGTFIN
jgi:cell wall-associated NlpC family hydrolase